MPQSRCGAIFLLAESRSIQTRSESTAWIAIYTISRRRSLALLN